MTFLNRTFIDDTHPCYEINIISSTVKRNPSTLCVLFYIFISSVSAVTVLGNLLVIISVIYFQQLHTPTNFLIISLAVTDLLVGFVVFPLNVEFSATSCLYNSNVLCNVRNSFDITLSTASIFHLCFISIDRYYAVCQPLTYRTKINVHVVVIMIFCLFVIGLNVEKCLENCLFFANILGPMFSFYLPVIIMLCIYLKIFLVAQKQAHSIQNCHSKKKGLTVRKVEGKATRTLAIVMGVFLMCLSPFFLCLAAEFLGSSPVPAEVFETVAWLALFNSMLNPFIYAFFYSWFRSAFRLILSGKIFQGNFSHTKLV
uniref:Trace amine associated receptor 1 n=1 Tax=Salarias fasciatus TaxID=181472 RepID=A0A672FRP9_SALFA